MARFRCKLCGGETDRVAMNEYGDNAIIAHLENKHKIRLDDIDPEFVKTLSYEVNSV